MMKCKNCGCELSTDSKFCKECGTNILEEVQGSSSEPNKTRKSKLIVLFGVIFISTVLIIGFCALYLNNSTRSFKKLYSDNEHTEANKIYIAKIKDNDNKKKEIEKFLEEELVKIESDFNDKKTSCDDAIKKLETLSNYTIISTKKYDSKKRIQALNNSRQAYNLAEEYINNKQYTEALTKYKKVIERDDNYTDAQDKIKKYLPILREECIKNEEEFANNKDYDSALDCINTALVFFSNDEQLKAKKSIYIEKKKEAEILAQKQKIEKMISEQKMIVVSASIDSDWLHDSMAKIIVQNKTDKTVKRYSVGILGYDKNGYPCDIGFLNDDQLLTGSGKRNIQPGEKFGYDVGWDLDSKEVKKILACVRDVEYYDGTEWTNSYYQIWKDEHYEKPLN